MDAPELHTTMNASPVVARRRRAERFSTSTVASSGQLVPWLAADGPLAYRPEEPPDRDYYFQYGWVLPGVLKRSGAGQHYMFGSRWKQHASELFAFWLTARARALDPGLVSLGRFGADAVTAPLAVYRTSARWGRAAYAIIQHGSYQVVPVDDQPLLERGEVVLYRGINEARVFRQFQVGTLDDVRRETWRRYLAVQAHVLSDATKSFNSIHDRAVRCETEHIRDRTWMTDDVARQHGLEIGRPGFARTLWENTHQSFSLVRWVAEQKFGPSFVMCKTPLGNIRITSFFAGEHEARIIDPNRLEIVEAFGCQVVPFGC